MGLQIAEIVPRKEIKILDLKGKIICVDAFNTLYQFLSTIRQPDGTPLMDSKKRITSHLSGLFYRNVSLLTQGLKLIYVFDGKPPALKGGTHELREEIRDSMKEKYEQAKKDEDIESMRKYSSLLIRLNDEMIEVSKELLKAMGIAVVQAPGEGEAEAAYLSKTHESYGIVSQDYDSLLFGATRLIRNLGLARKRKTVSGWVEI
ncbi:MAG: FEN1 family endonuclease, partial [Nanoarchaeota archaeon]